MRPSRSQQVKMRRYFAYDMAASPRLTWLDTFRGLAAALMVANHVGFKLGSPEAATQGLSGAITFLGSFAPVLFFFATGLGVAVSSHNRRRSWASVAEKCVLLVLADLLLQASQGRVWGLDFFAFIAVSYAVASACMACQRPRRAAAGAALLALVLRYGIAPLHVDVSAFAPWASPLWSWFTGWPGIVNVSYPAAPWVIYPLLGVVCAPNTSAAATDPARTSVANRRFLACVCLLSFGLALASSWRGASFFRWGTMAAAFFVLSLGVLAGSVLLAQWISARPKLNRAVTLKGSSSFLVVPIHYALIEAIRSLYGTPVAVGNLSGLLLVAGLLPVSFLASTWLARALDAPWFQRPLIQGAMLLLPLMWLAWRATSAAGSADAGTAWISFTMQAALIVVLQRKASSAKA